MNKDSATLEYQRFNTEKYREIALKINVYFNNNYKNKGQKGLIIISMDSFPNSNRRFFKSFINQEEHFKNQ